MTAQHTETLIIGAGQAGLATAYHLRRLGRECLIVDGNQRVGDTWRRHYDGLRLYTPIKYDSLPGLDPWEYPSKDDVADYLEAYALHFDLPIRMSTKVDRLERADDRLSPGLQLDRHRHLRRARLARRVPRDRRVGPGPLLLRPLVPVRVHLHAAARRRP